MTVIMLFLMLVVLGLFVASLVWVYRDANRRGKPGWIIALLVAFLAWPLAGTIQLMVSFHRISSGSCA